MDQKERLYDDGDDVDHVNRVALLRYPPSSVQHIPEACHLTWTDPHFDDQLGIIAVFDREAEKAGNAAAKRFIDISICFAISLICSCLSRQLILGILHLTIMLVSAWQAWRTKQFMLTQHVAVTTEGIRIEDGSINLFPFLPFEATPARTVSIPFEHVRKISIRNHEYCCREDPTLLVVVISLRSQPVDVMELLGIIHAEEFVDLVMALKKRLKQGTAITTTTTSTGSYDHLELPIMTSA